MKIRLVKKSEISSYMPIFKKIMGKTYLIRMSDSGIEVIEYMCRHQHASLEGAKVEGGVVTCPRHHWKYDIVTGKCLSGNGAPLKFCKFEEDEEWIYLLVELD